jgi:hypothetical protein
LSQIDRSRRSLLAKLREYKGQDCEVIHEAAAFAGERIERDDGLVLPPYSDHVTNSFALDDLYPLSYMSKPKRLHTQPDSDGDDDGTAQDGARRNGRESRDTGASKRGSGGGAGGGGGGIGAFMGWVAKTAAPGWTLRVCSVAVVVSRRWRRAAEMSGAFLCGALPAKRWW